MSMRLAIKSQASTAALAPPDPRSGLDGLSWFLVSLVLLIAVPIGFVSGDGIAHSARIANGTWFWNPNHLLMEPISAWWQTALTEHGFPRSGPDQLKLLSIIAGSVSVGIFRWRIAARIAPGRIEANHGTAWFAFGSAFNRLWISDETHMLQMPMLIALGIAAVWYVEQPGWRRAVAMGAAAALSGLFFISNTLIGAALTIVLMAWHFARSEPRSSVELLVASASGGAAFALGGFLAAWTWAAPEDTNFAFWLLSYGGGQVDARVADSYGIEASFIGIITALARSLYGSASAFVDLAPIVEVFRDGVGLDWPLAVNVLAFVAGSILLLACLAHTARYWQNGGRKPVLIASGWVIAIIAFGTFWDNSDDQFYFQLAVPIGLFVSQLSLSGRKGLVLVTLSGLALAWNLADMVGNRILYPRSERIGILEEVLLGSGLVVYPGQDEVDHLMYFMDGGPDEKLAITALMSRYDAVEGLMHLQARVEEAIATGRRVDIISVFDVPPMRHPWKALQRAGYGQSEVIGVLEAFGVDSVSRRNGPFTVRSLSPRARTHD